MLSGDFFDAYTKPNYPGFNFYYYWITFGIYFDTENGFGLTDPWNISCFNAQKGLLICNDGKINVSEDSAFSTMHAYSIVLPTKLDGTLRAFDQWHRMLALTTTHNEQLPPFKGLKISGLRTLMPIKSYERFIDKQPKFIVKSITVEMKTSDKVIWTIGKCEEAENSLNKLADDMQKDNQSLYSLTEIFFSPSEENSVPGRIAKCWKDIIGGPIIPFDMDKRHAIISKLDDSFKSHIEHWSVEKSRRTR